MIYTQPILGKIKSYIIWILLLLYIYFIFKVILFKFHPVDMGHLLVQLQKSLQHPDMIVNKLDSSANLVLLKTIKKQAAHVTIHNVVNLLGNFSIFVPFGLLVSIVSRKVSSGFLVLMISFALSLCLESLQLMLSMGTFDVDDLLLNTAGGFAGYVIFYLSMMLRGMLSANNVA
ncbi:VanZ family protein [Paenibacillus sp. Marseille-Q4541]|uniref:VanZ family protein n=1 Tax=Paenibacillus sp. Marseille-Q4541 TaxID=2831522 RepID=UPI001BAC3E1E|nr:VanZ family protein [Paenibacillus sp. Marseille-Q4541]